MTSEKGSPLLDDDESSPVTVEDFKLVDLHKALSGIHAVEGYAMLSPLLTVADESDSRGERGAGNAYRLIATLMAFCFRVQDQATIFGPRVRNQEGRTATASDLSRAQNEVLATVATSIVHPAVRARVADVVWYNERKYWHMADIAVDAYCEVVEKRLSGFFRHSYQEGDGVDQYLIDVMERALQILAGVGKRASIPARAVACVQAIYNRAKDRLNFATFVRISRLAQSCNLIAWQVIANDAEALAKSSDTKAYPMALKGVWDLAAEAHGKLNNSVEQGRCKEASVEQILRMRDQVSSPMAKASWTMDAIGELRSMGGHRERIKLLRLELMDFQDQSLDEIACFTVPTDYSEERQGAIDIFQGLALPDVFGRFAAWWRPAPVAELRSTALRNREEFFFSSMSNKYIDRKGKFSASSPGDGDGKGEPDLEWFKAQWQRELDIRRHRLVASIIVPVLQNTTQRFPVEERHFSPIVAASPFVPQGHSDLFALGFARLFQGDYCSAAFLLIPQLENSIRYVMSNVGKESSKIKPDLLEEDRSLSGLLQNMRPEVEQIFGVDLVNEVDLLFNQKGGPNLRHEMAHGKITIGDCYHHSVIYGCWMIYYLTVVPLLSSWKEQIAPQIEAAAH